MNDLISRQAAINAMESAEWYHQNQNKDMVSGANSAEHQAWYKADDVYRVLEQLPSAQPEIIRCKDCIFHGLCRTSPKWAVAPKDDWFCADAERRTDD